MGEETRVFQKDLFFYEVDSGRSIRVFDGFVIGREGCHWNVSTDPSVSRRHLKISVDETRVYIEDLNTKNKTLLNGKPIEPGMKYLLTPDDEVDVGNHKFVFRNHERGTDVPSFKPPIHSTEPTPPRVPIIQLRQAENPVVSSQPPPPPPLPSSSVQPQPDQLPKALLPEVSASILTLDSATNAKASAQPPVISTELELSKYSAGSGPLPLLDDSLPPPPPLAVLPKTSEKPAEAVAPVKKVVVPPPPPSRARVRSAARRARWGELGAFVRFKHCSRFYLAVFLLSLSATLWRCFEDLRLIATSPALPRTQDLLIDLLLALLVSYGVSFFPSWWSARMKLGTPLLRQLMIPISGVAFSAMVFLVSAQLGYEDASQWNRVAAYCVAQFEAAGCVNALQASNGGLTRLPMELQDQIRAKLLASSNPAGTPAPQDEADRAPASEQPSR